MTSTPLNRPKATGTLSVSRSDTGGAGRSNGSTCTGRSAANATVALKTRMTNAPHIHTVTGTGRSCPWNAASVIVGRAMISPIPYSLRHIRPRSSRRRGVQRKIYRGSPGVN